MIPQEEIKDYKKKGYIIKEFKKSNYHNKLLQTLQMLEKEELKEGFFFQYNEAFHRKDLLPVAYRYDNIFFEILFDNNIHELVEKTVGKTLTLVNIAVVNSMNPGYMSDWHSDNYKNPIHKIIFYPSFTGKSESDQLRMEVLEGHIKSNSRLTYNKFTKKIEPKVFAYHKRTIYANDNQYLWVNTQTLHRAMPVLNEPNAIRVLYSFREQFSSDQEIEAYLKTSKGGTVDDVKNIMNIYQQKFSLAS